SSHDASRGRAAPVRGQTPAVSAGQAPRPTAPAWLRGEPPARRIHAGHVRGQTLDVARGPPTALACVDLRWLPRFEPELVVAEPACALRQRFLAFRQVAVAVVERRRSVLELLLAPSEPALGSCHVTLAVGDVGLTRLDARHRLRQPGAALVQLAGGPRQLPRAIVERPLASLEPL